MTERAVTITVDHDSCIGAWEITCADCPLLPHLAVLKEKARPCVAGLQTGMQGAIPMKQCTFLGKDSVKEDSNGGIVLTCHHGED